MEIKILAFGIAKDILSTNKTTLELPANTTVHSLKEHLLSVHPDFNKLKSLRFAVNEEYVEDTYELVDGDEVVLIPPVSGG